MISERNKEMISAFIEKFQINKDTELLFGKKDLSDYDKDIAQEIIEFIQQNIGHRVDFYYSQEDVCLRYLGIIDESCSVTFSPSFPTDRYFTQEILEVAQIPLSELNKYAYCTNRSKGNEIEGYKHNVVSGIIAILHSFVYRNQFKEGLIDAFREPMDGFSIYHFGDLSTIKAGSAGNHRLYGCKLFAPLLGDSMVKFTNLNVYTATDQFMNEQKVIKRIVDFFKRAELFINIMYEQNGNLEIKCFRTKKEQKSNDYFFQVYSDMVSIENFCTPKLLNCLQDGKNLRAKNRFYFLTNDCKNIRLNYDNNPVSDRTIQEAHAFIRRKLYPWYKNILFSVQDLIKK